MYKFLTTMAGVFLCLSLAYVAVPRAEASWIPLGVLPDVPRCQQYLPVVFGDELAAPTPTSVPDYARADLIVKRIDIWWPDRDMDIYVKNIGHSTAYNVDVCLWLDGNTSVSPLMFTIDRVLPDDEEASWFLEVCDPDTFVYTDTLAIVDCLDEIPEISEDNNTFLDNYQQH